jgi:hypothetical protein
MGANESHIFASITGMSSVLLHSCMCILWRFGRISLLTAMLGRGTPEDPFMVFFAFSAALTRHRAHPKA